MMHGYSTSLEEYAGQLPLPTLLLTLLRGKHTRSEASEETATDLHVHRLLCLMSVVLLLAFGAVFELTGSNGISGFWPEVALAVIGLAGLVASYRSPRMVRYFEHFSHGLCFAVTSLFVILTAANGFAAAYAIGLVFILPGIGMGYSVSLDRMGPLVAYFATAVGLTALVYALTPAPMTAPLLFLGSLLSMSALTLLVAGSRLKAEKRFQASEERYRAVVEQASDGIYLLDAETLRFLDSNTAYQRMVGYTHDELRRMTIMDLVAVERHSIRSSLGHIFSGNHAHVAERLLRRKDGTTICVEMHIDRILYGEREVLSVVVHDISLRRQYEERLIAAKEQAESIARFKSTLLTNMSHELRTPLSSILGCSAVLNEEVSERQRELVSLIEESGRRLHNTLDNVLELARLDAEGLELRPEVVNVVGEASAVMRGMERQADAKGLDLVIERPAHGVWAEIDASSLRGILTHLVDNAIKFTEKGTVTVTVEMAVRELRIHVRDTGVGISENFVPHLFQEFKQESEGLTRCYEGNGLGLAICGRLINLLGGEIQVRSTQGMGSCFTVCIPDVAIQGRRQYFADRQVA